MKVQQTLAQTWKRRRDSDHATAKRLIEERGVGLLRVPDELLDIILGYSDLRTRFVAATTSHQFCDSIARLSPRLEYQLVRKKFPLLARGNWAGMAERQTAPSTLRAQFRWSGPDDIVDMSLTDACMTLEHWVDWRG